MKDSFQRIVTVFFRRSNKDVDEDSLSRTYKRAAIWLGIGALMWFGAYLYGNREGWGEQTLFIPIACAALSALFFSLHSKSKQ